MDFHIICILFIMMLYETILPRERGVKLFGFIHLRLVLVGEECNPTSSFDLRARGVCNRLKKAKKGKFILCLIITSMVL